MYVKRSPLCRVCINGCTHHELYGCMFICIIFACGYGSSVCTHVSVKRMAWIREKRHIHTQHTHTNIKNNNKNRKNIRLKPRTATTVLRFILTYDNRVRYSHSLSHIFFFYEFASIFFFLLILLHLFETTKMEKTIVKITILFLFFFKKKYLSGVCLCALLRIRMYSV